MKPLHEIKEPVPPEKQQLIKYLNKGYEMWSPWKFENGNVTYSDIYSKTRKILGEEDVNIHLRNMRDKKFATTANERYFRINATATTTATYNLLDERAMERIRETVRRNER